MQEVILFGCCSAAQSEQTSLQPEADGVSLLITTEMIKINNRKHLLDEAAYVL